MIEVGEDDIRTMTITVWGEARNQHKAGQIAVAWVILNRAFGGQGGRFGVTPAAACKKAWQFSCWNRRDPQYVKMCRHERTFPLGLNEIRELVEAVCRGEYMDPTFGSTHYLNPAAVTPGQRKRAGMLAGREHVVIGDHHFYRPEDLTPPEAALTHKVEPRAPRQPVVETYPPLPEARPARPGFFRRALAWLRG